MVNGVFVEDTDDKYVFDGDQYYKNSHGCKRNIFMHLLYEFSLNDTTSHDIISTLINLYKRQPAQAQWSLNMYDNQGENILSKSIKIRKISILETFINSKAADVN
jgi:hypothetical protein